MDSVPTDSISNEYAYMACPWGSFMLGQWYKKVEPAVKAKPFTPFFGSPNYMVTRDGNTLFVHFHRDACSSGFTLNPLDIVPASVTLLNTGEPLQASVVYLPRRWFTKQGKREQPHVQGVPVNTLLDEVMVVKIEFEELADEYLLEVSQRPNPEDAGVLCGGRLRGVCRVR